MVDGSEPILNVACRQIGMTLIVAMLSPCFAVESEVDFKYYVPLYHRQLQNQTHSVISSWKTAWEANQMGTSNRALTVLGCILVSVMPVCETVCLFVICFVSMNNNSHHRMEIMLQAVSDWACMDVFLVVLLVAKAQTPILASKLNKNFHVALFILPATYALVVAAIGLLVLRTYLQCLHRSSLQKRCSFLLVSNSLPDSHVEETELQEQNGAELGTLLVQESSEMSDLDSFHLSIEPPAVS